VKLKNFKGDGRLPVLYTVRNSFLYKKLNQILEKLIPMGIPQYLVKYHEANMFGTFIASGLNGPTVLTVEDLTYGFVLWLGACGVSTVAFLMENLWFRVTRVLWNFVNLWIILTFLRRKLF
jgi:hypothetical protein